MFRGARQRLVGFLFLSCLGGIAAADSSNPAILQWFDSTYATQRERVADHAARRGEQLGERLRGWQAKFSQVGDVRGLGPMAAVEFVVDRGTRSPARELLQAIASRCLERGVILISAGTHGNVMRFLFPLVITEAQLNEGLDVIEGVLGELVG